MTLPDCGDMLTLTVTCTELKTGGFKINVDGKVSKAEKGSTYQLKAGNTVGLKATATEDGPLELDDIGWISSNPKAKCPTEITVTLIVDGEEHCTKDVRVTC